jgi:hypothetical protein
VVDGHRRADQRIDGERQSCAASDVVAHEVAKVRVALGALDTRDDNSPTLPDHLRSPLQPIQLRPL